ncbi:hypothetical protein JHK87_039924 [Glycine soja]|nr:hypothetical protein JHK87_039924 [Glycine soja]
MHGSSTKKNKEYQEKLPIVVLRAEGIIYSKANFKVCKKPGEERARDIYTGEMCKKPGEEGARDIYTGEGWFKMLSLSRSFTVADNSGMKSRTGGLSVSLAGPDGWVIGGGVVGLLTVVLSDSETVQVLYLL